MFPARAGMSRRGRFLDNDRIDVPRASGDEPDIKAGKVERGVCSPRERG